MGYMDMMKKIFFALLSALLIVFPGRPSYALFSHSGLTTEEERELGREFMRFVRKNLVLVEDPVIVAYVNRVGKYVVSCFPPSPFDFSFYVVQEEVYNAFAGPGGHVFINSGLLAAMENEDQLAGLLTHEISHVYGRHIAERIAQSKKISLATMAGILAGVFLGGSGATASAIGTTSVALGQSAALQFSREHEMEADQMGLPYLAKAGYHGEGLLEVLKTIREKQWFGSSQVPSYLQTHPAVEERMAYIDTWIHARPEWAVESKATRLGDFRKIRTRVIALCGDITSAHNTFDAEIRDRPSDPLGFYGKGLLLDREGRREEATENLEKAIERSPLDVDILRDIGKTRFHMGDYDAALKALRGALAFRSNDLESLFFLGRSQMMTNDLAGAKETFEAALNDSPGFLPAMYYLGETYGKLGDLAEAHYYLGLYYKEKGEVKNARFHLERALKLSTGSAAREETLRNALRELPKPEKSKS